MGNNKHFIHGGWCWCPKPPRPPKPPHIQSKLGVPQSESNNEFEISNQVPFNISDSSRAIPIAKSTVLQTLPLQLYILRFGTVPLFVPIASLNLVCPKMCQITSFLG
jgi:hypothetical protein